MLDEPVRCHRSAPHAVRIPDEQARPDVLECGIGRDRLCDTPRLVEGEGVHRVEDQGLDPGLVCVPPAVIEDRQEEALGLAGAGAGGDECRLRFVVERGEALERGRLVLVGSESETVRQW